MSVQPVRSDSAERDGLLGLGGACTHSMGTTLASRATGKAVEALAQQPDKAAVASKLPLGTWSTELEVVISEHLTKATVDFKEEAVAKGAVADKLPLDTWCTCTELEASAQHLTKAKVDVTLFLGLAKVTVDVKLLLDTWPTRAFSNFSPVTWTAKSSGVSTSARGLQSA